MAISWDELQKRQDELSQVLVDPSLENSKRLPFQKELSQLTSLLEKHNGIVSLEQQVAEAKTQAAQSDDAELAELFREEIQVLEPQLKILQNELEDLLYPPDEYDNKNIYLEIRAGAGGQEAALFAGDLLKMYSNYALKKHWKATVESSSSTDLGGFREVVLLIQGKGVYGHLKRESGVHRVQRVPATETQGRVHTSTATIAVLPEAKEVDVSISPDDLRIDVYRASGAGGQHVNTTDSAVRITHIPTGVVVTCQDERSQHKNKAKAMKMLKSRILAAQVEKRAAEMSKARKDQVGTGMRAEKVRTYNYPQNRITDHQVNLTLNKLEFIMLGDLDEIIQALREKDRQDRRKQALIFSS